MVPGGCMVSGGAWSRWGVPGPGGLVETPSPRQLLLFLLMHQYPKSSQIIADLVYTTLVVSLKKTKINKQIPYYTAVVHCLFTIVKFIFPSHLCVLALVASQMYDRRGLGSWIGLAYDSSESDWVWIDGSVASYTNWAPDEPQFVRLLC